MRRQWMLAIVVVTMVMGAGAAMARQGQQPQARPVPQSPEWEKLRTLVGNWEGTMSNGQAATAEVRLTGDGSALMHLLGKDSPHEMVTMIHPDGKRIVATHYCAVHNQPRMALVPSPAPNQVAFEFFDGTSIQPGDGHMQKLVVTFVDADHHDETWVVAAGGKELGKEVFHFARKK